MPCWLEAARAAATDLDWPEAARLLLSHADAWPDEPTVLVDIARWLRLSGHGGRAGQVLDRAARHGDSYDVQREADALEWPLTRPDTPPDPATLLLDIRDLLQFLHDHGSVSGIQRVQLGILASVLEGDAGPLGAGCLAVFPSMSDGAIWAPPEATLRAIVAHCTGHGLNQATARRLVAQARARARRVVPAAGAAFLILGAFWSYVGAPRFLLSLRTQGVRLGVLIYDLFPLTHPECTTADTRQYFLQALGEGLPFWEFALAISEYSAAAFRRVVADRGVGPIETVAIPLAHSFDLGRAAPPGWLDTWPPALGDLRGRDFVLSVSTIEVRKNHLLLFHAWQRMIEAGDNPPTLVLVGRPGWGVADLLAQLEATRWLDGRVMMVHGLSDAELEALYRACLFTVMPSFAEGWGLAVGESLSFGKPCIAAGTGALPEVGGDLVAYADPGSVPEWVARMRSWMQDRTALAEAAARIASEFVPRRWPAVTRHLLAEADRMRQAPAAPLPRVVPMRLAAGETMAIGVIDLSRPGAAGLGLGQAMAFETGWHPLEAGLCWMRDRQARFAAQTTLPPGEAVQITFDLVTPPWEGGNGLTLDLEGGQPSRHPVQFGEALRVAAEGVVPADGVLRVGFVLDHTQAPHERDQRGLSIGVGAVSLRQQASAPASQAGAQAWAQPGAQAVAQPGVAPGGATVDGFWVDLSSLCAPPTDVWSARRWRLGLAQALARVPGLRWAASRGHDLVEVPRDLALALLGAPPAARAAMLEAARGGLAPLPLRPGDRLLTLGLAADNTPARLARRAGALVTLVIAATATLLRPHRAMGDAAGLRAALFAPHAPFDAVLLARDDPAASALFTAEARPLPWAVLPEPTVSALPLASVGDPGPGAAGCVLAESLEPVVGEAWSLLRDPPVLQLLGADDSAALGALLGSCRMVLAPNLAGAWPGLALAAAEAGVPCLDGLDPADARASAAAMQSLLDARHVVARRPAPVTWDALALAVLRFDPMHPPQPTAGRPAASLPADPGETWALTAIRRA